MGTKIEKSASDARASSLWEEPNETPKPHSALVAGAQTPSFAFSTPMRDAFLKNPRIPVQRTKLGRRPASTIAFQIPSNGETNLGSMDRFLARIFLELLKLSQTKEQRALPENLGLARAHLQNPAQLEHGLGRLLKPFPKEIDTFVIQDRMDAIHEALTLLPNEYNPLNDPFDFYEMRTSPFLITLFKAMVFNFVVIMDAEPLWDGIQLLASQMGKALAPMFIDSQPLADALLYLTSHRDYPPDLLPLSPSPSQKSRGIVYAQFHFVRYKTKNTPSHMAHQLFSLSRGNPPLASCIIADLCRLASDEKTRPQAIRILRELIQVSQDFKADDALVVRDYSSITKTDTPFYLLTSPTLFAPENWTATTLDALKTQDLQGKTLIEIGTGTGILPIFLAKFKGVKKIYSVDANPDAKNVATLNAWLASCDEHGNKLPGPQPIDMIEFGDTPDLLTGVSKRIKADGIFACLPQVPSHDVLTSRNLADRYASHGYPEDKDGLELLARLLEQAKDYLSSDGWVTLIVSGRPGLEAVQHMANRRGYVPTLIHETIFSQDKWTDLSSFVAIETNGLRPPFHFLLDGVEITATAAHRGLNEFKTLFLAASENEERNALMANPRYAVRHPQYVILFRPITQFSPHWEKRAMGAVQDFLETKKHIGYTQNTGEESQPFRVELAARFSSFFGLPIPPEVLFVGPNRGILSHNLALALGKFPTVMPLAADLRSLQTEIQKNIEADQPILLLANADHPNLLDQVGQLFKNNPKARRLVFVLWEELNFQETTSLAALMVWDEQIFETLEMIGEDTYSRASTLELVSQTERLKAQREAGFPIPSFFANKNGSAPALLVKSAPTALHHDLKTFKAHPPSLGPPPSDGPQIIDMSFGESEFQIPNQWQNHLARALEHRGGSEKVRTHVSNFLQDTRWAYFDPDREIILGGGVHSLVYATLQSLADTKGESRPFSVLIPKGHYGQFLPTIHLAGGKGLIVPNQPKMQSAKEVATYCEQLEEIVQSAKTRGEPVLALFLQYPTNPAGLYYSRQALETLVRFCQKHQIYLLVDEIFYGTGEPQDQTSVFSLMNRMEYKDYFNQYVVGFSGLSKDFAMGGARFGFAFSKNHPWLRAINHELTAPPDNHALQLARTIYQPAVWHPYLEKHREWLLEKRKRLLETLEPFAKNGLLSFAKPEGGYFVEVDVSRLFGKTIPLNGIEYRVGKKGENLRKIFYDATGLKISDVGWSGNPSTLRLVYSIQNLEEALGRLTHLLGSFKDTSQHLTMKHQPEFELQELPCSEEIPKQGIPSFETPISPFLNSILPALATTAVTAMGMGANFCFV